MAEIVLAGRSRWKVENENNNTLKTKGYNLEHNFGHGKQQLALFLATLNILSLMYFQSWDHLLTFMLEGLELEIPNTS